MAPGFVETSLSRSVMGDNPEHDLTPWPRLGTVSDIASAVAFLASDESEWMTGSVLVMDGGYTARVRTPRVSGTVLKNFPLARRVTGSW